MNTKKANSDIRIDTLHDYWPSPVLRAYMLALHSALHTDDWAHPISVPVWPVPFERDVSAIAHTEKPVLERVRVNILAGRLWDECFPMVFEASGLEDVHVKRDKNVPIYFSQNAQIIEDAIKEVRQKREDREVKGVYLRISRRRAERCVEFALHEMYSSCILISDCEWTWAARSAANCAIYMDCAMRNLGDTDNRVFGVARSALVTALHAKPEPAANENSIPMGRWSE